jgi:hypothetical protein
VKATLGDIGVESFPLELEAIRETMSFGPSFELRVPMEYPVILEVFYKSLDVLLALFGIGAVDATEGG